MPEAPGKETDTLIAHNTIYHNASYPSALILPVVNGWSVGETAGKGWQGLRFSSNPFRTTCEVSFFLPEMGRVSLMVYDISGRLVETPLSGTAAAGRNTAIFGENLGPGVYYLVLETGTRMLKGRVVKLR
ncbi:MAG: T9SS type A sorting domain-containing protein [candidate division WOR-3 bacterium]